MQPRKGTASDFVLTTLQKYPDRELRVSDLVELAEGRFKAENVVNSLQAFLKDGQVVRVREGREAWWAIALGGGEPKVETVEPPKEPGEAPGPKKIVKRPTMAIRNGRW